MINHNEHTTMIQNLITTVDFKVKFYLIISYNYV